MSRGKAWTREELILAINLYCRTPFGRIHVRNPEIIELAKTLGRTPGSISYKLANFASIDPSLPRKGAANVSKLDIEVWNEFFNDWEKLIFKSEQMVFDYKIREPDGVDFHWQQVQGINKSIQYKARVNQSFFRRMILSSYNNSCCITGLAVPELLIASHIIPWSMNEKNRMNPRNGLCLNALHDMAFDKGFISISVDYRVMISDNLKQSVSQSTSFDFFLKFEDKKIEMPSRFIPDNEFLDFHRKNIFLN